MNKRKHLEAHADAVRDIELTEAAINILERVATTEAQRVILILKHGQGKVLARIDRAAEKLDAPYPKVTEPCSI